MRDGTHAEQIAGLREKAQADRRSAERARRAAADVGREIDDTTRSQQLEAELEAQAGAARIVEDGPGLLVRRWHQVEEAQARYRELRTHTERDVDGGLARDQASQFVADAREQVVNKQAQLEQEADQNDASADETERTISALTTERTAQRQEETARAATVAQRLRVIDHIRSSIPVDQRK